jgi:hypothetical protein
MGTASSDSLIGVVSVSSGNALSGWAAMAAALLKIAMSSKGPVGAAAESADILCMQKQIMIF